MVASGIYWRTEVLTGIVWRGLTFAERRRWSALTRPEDSPARSPKTI